MEIDLKEIMRFACKEFTLAALLIFAVSIVIYPAYHAAHIHNKSLNQTSNTQIKN